MLSDFLVLWLIKFHWTANRTRKFHVCSFTQFIAINLFFSVKLVGDLFAEFAAAQRQPHMAMLNWLHIFPNKFNLIDIHE